MAQRKSRKPASNRKRKAPSAKSNRKKTPPNRNIEKYLGIIIISALLTFFASQFRYEISNSVYKYDCVEAEAGDYPTQLVYNAINIQHSIKDNPNRKAELLEYLADRVIWFRRSKTETPKSKIRTYSVYDEFCYAEYPTFDSRDEMNNNYEMNFIGVHRYRKIDSLYVKAEKYYCEIRSGKISKLYSVPINNLEKGSFSKVNSVFRYFYVYLFVGFMLLFLLVNYLTSLPETIIRVVVDLAKKFIPGL